jgi:hypothetical protein
LSNIFGPYRAQLSPGDREQRRSDGQRPDVQRLHAGDDHRGERRSGDAAQEQQRVAREEESDQQAGLGEDDR